MPETLLDAETSMTGTRVSVIKELSVVWERKRSKHWEIVLISQMSQSLDCNGNRGRAASRPWIPAFSGGTFTK